MFIVCYHSAVKSADIFFIPVFSWLDYPISTPQYLHLESGSGDGQLGGGALMKVSAKWWCRQRLQRDTDQLSLKSRNKASIGTNLIPAEQTRSIRQNQPFYFLTCIATAVWVRRSDGSDNLCKASAPDLVRSIWPDDKDRINATAETSSEIAMLCLSSPYVCVIRKHLTRFGNGCASWDMAKEESIRRGAKRSGWLHTLRSCIKMFIKPK